MSKYCTAQDRHQMWYWPKLLLHIYIYIYIFFFFLVDEKTSNFIKMEINSIHLELKPT